IDRIAYINGYPDGSVRPDGGVTRAEVASMLFRLLSYADKNDPLASEFTDVEEGKWYSQAVAYLAGMGILEGYNDGSFRPNAQITRAEFSAVISRFDASEGSDMTERFSDVPASYWAFALIDNVAEKEWLNGYPDGTFKPQNTITRAETVTAINNMLTRELSLSAVPADAQVYTDLTERHWAYTDMVEATYDWVAAAANAAGKDAEADDADATDEDAETE
ncbi:MAG: S-layer homology domain-containing protein, partial [Clostridiales Family XIII bacterium]|nr:S-layer homology domain-containing protein [Clostridiales Family XIII bacterium]